MLDPSKSLRVGAQVALLLIFFSVVPAAHALEFDRYHEQSEIAAYLRQVAVDYPDHVQFVLMGQSAEGREIAYIRLTAPGDRSGRGAIYLNGTHHGNEKSSTEGMLGVIDFLLERLDDPFVEELLTSYELYLQPLVNPDGHARNTRGDSRGRDPNRDYAYPGRSEAQSFDLPEIQLVKELVDTTEPAAAIAMHSGMEGVLWPWCFTGERTPDHDIFLNLSRWAAGAMEMSLYRQSYYDYPTRGEFIDYVYMKFGTLGVTFEVSRQPTPRERDLAYYVTKTIQGTMAYLEGISNLETWREDIGRDVVISAR